MEDEEESEESEERAEREGNAIFTPATKLSALAECNDGFAIAQVDLELRGPVLAQY